MEKREAGVRDPAHGQRMPARAGQLVARCCDRHSRDGGVKKHRVG
jgi:hypothetical protein